MKTTTKTTTKKGYGLINKSNGKPISVVNSGDSYYLSDQNDGQEFFVENLEEAEIVANYSTPYYNSSPQRPNNSLNIKLQIVKVEQTTTCEKVETFIYKKIPFMFVSDPKKEEVVRFSVKDGNELIKIYSRDDIDLLAGEKAMIDDRIVRCLGRDTDNLGRIIYYCEGTL